MTDKAPDPTKKTNFTARAVSDKSEEDLRKLLLNLGKLTLAEESGQAFMPMSLSLRAIEQRLSNSQLRCSIVPLDENAASALWRHSRLSYLSMGNTKYSWLACIETSASPHTEQHALLAPKSVRQIDFPVGDLGGQQVLLLPPLSQLQLTPALLGYAGHYSDAVIVVGHKDNFVRFTESTKIDHTLQALLQQAGMVLPCIISDSANTSNISLGNAWKQWPVCTPRLINNKAEHWQALFAEGVIAHNAGLAPLRNSMLNLSGVRQANIVATVLAQQSEQKLLTLDRSQAQLQARKSLMSLSALSSERKTVLQRLQAEFIAEIDQAKEAIDAQGKNEIVNKKALVLHIRQALETLNQTDFFNEELKKNFLSRIGLGWLGQFFGNSTIILGLCPVASEKIRESFETMLLDHVSRVGRQMNKSLNHSLTYFQTRLLEEAELDEALNFQINIDAKHLEKLLNEHIYSQLDSATATYQVKFERKGLLAHITKARMAVSSIFVLGAMMATAAGADRPEISEMAVYTGSAIGAVLLINILFWPSVEKHQKHEYLNDLREKLFKILNDIVHKVIGQYCNLYKQKLDLEQKRLKQQFDIWIRQEDDNKVRRQAAIEQLSKKQNEWEISRRGIQEALLGSLSRPGAQALSRDSKQLAIQLQANIKLALESISTQEGGA
jgi:hypothetical protein